MQRKMDALTTQKQRKALMDVTTPEDLHKYRVDRHTFTIYVGGDPDVEDYESTGAEPGVEHRMADRFDLNLGLLSSISTKRPILVQIASCGGNWTEGMQMFGAILACPNPVTVLATKWARSMTSIIPLAADRFLLRPPAKYMYHRGMFGFWGLDQEMDTDDIERRKAHETMMRIYATRLREQGKFTSWSEDRIRSMLDKGLRDHIDVWYSGEEAVEAGFVDEVFSGDFSKLRAKKRNMERRNRMLEVLRKPIKVNVTVS